MNHWLGRGAGGWRLDAAYAVPPGFWAKVLPAVRESFPSAWFLGEMIHGDYAAYAEESGLDSITQYELWKAIWSSLNDRNFFELDHALGRHNEFLDGDAPADVRRQPRRDPAGHGPERRAALRARARRAVLRRGRAECVLRGRAGVPRAEGGPGGRRRRDPARLSPVAGGPAAGRLVGLPAAPAPDRLPSPPPVAGPRPDVRRAPGQRGARAARNGVERRRRSCCCSTSATTPHRFPVDAGTLVVAETPEAGRDSSPTRCWSRAHSWTILA